MFFSFSTTTLSMPAVLYLGIAIPFLYFSSRNDNGNLIVVGSTVRFVFISIVLMCILVDVDQARTVCRGSVVG